MRFVLLASASVVVCVAACASGNGGGGFGDPDQTTSSSTGQHATGGGGGGGPITTATGPATSTTTTASTTTTTTSASSGGSQATAGGGGQGGAGGHGGAGGASSTMASTASSTAASSTAASSSSTGGGGTCTFTHLVISQLLTRSTGGGNDEFVELYNPGPGAVALDGTWTVEARANDAPAYELRWKGSASKNIPANGHFLIVGTSYASSVAGDDDLLTGIKDASSVVLKHSSSVVDAVCTTWSAAQSYGTGFTCEGMPADNTPHDDGATGNVDASLVRGDDGCADTGSSKADFVKLTPSVPHNTSN